MPSFSKSGKSHVKFHQNIFMNQAKVLPHINSCKVSLFSVFNGATAKRLMVCMLYSKPQQHNHPRVKKRKERFCGLYIPSSLMVHVR